MAENTPVEGSMVPVAVLLLAQVPPVMPSLRVVVNPKQRLATPDIAEGVGFTVMVNVWAEPLQPFAEGVTEKSPEIAVVPLLVAANGAIVPVPDAPTPIAVLSLVQE
jgi:hypothetical protein